MPTGMSFFVNEAISVVNKQRGMQRIALTSVLVLMKRINKYREPYQAVSDNLLQHMPGTLCQPHGFNCFV